MKNLKKRDHLQQLAQTRGEYYKRDHLQQLGTDKRRVLQLNFKGVDLINLVQDTKCVVRPCENKHKPINK